MPLKTFRRVTLTTVSRVIRVLAWVLLRVVPPQPHAVVHGWPDNEANAVEVVRGLLRRYPHRTYWLVADQGAPALGDEAFADPRLILLRKDSMAALWRSVTAEVTFFTHGLVTAVAPPPSRLVVNLWHGDGPKATRQAALVKSTVVVSGAALWAAYKATLFGVSPRDVLLTGNPRIDQFDAFLPPAALRTLGLDPARPRVLWMPTYRHARGPRDRVWSDAARLSGNDEVHAFASALGAGARALSMDVVIKPHPLDDDSYEGLGCRVITGDDLDAAGVSLYQLLGQCQALISDVSSAWVDFLVLDRPIGFYLPDLDDLIAQRGLNVPDLSSLIPGPLLEDPAQAHAFLDRVATAASELRPSTYAGFARIGPVLGTGATDRLLDALDTFQESRHQAVFFGHSGGPERPGNQRSDRGGTGLDGAG